MRQTLDATVRFGDFELNLRSGELRRGGVPVAVQEQPLKVLLRLATRPGTLVTREELRQELWPSDTFVDFEHGLNAAIKRLRDTLGDSAEVPRFIETVPRRGYRLVAPVLPPITVAAQPPTLRYAPLAIGIAVMGLVLGGLAVLRWPPAERERRPVTSRPTTTPDGLERSPTLSPDGTQIAFLSRGELFVKPISANAELKLASNVGAAAWSPDGQWIAYIRLPAHDVLPAVSLIHPTGGDERLLKVLDAPASDLSWAPAGEALAIVPAMFTGRPPALHLLDIGSGTLTRVTNPPAGALGDAAPAFAPDGQALAFIRRFSEQGRSDVMLQTFGEEQPETLASFADGVPWDLAWLPDGSAVIASVQKTDTLMGLWRIPRGGGIPQALPIGEDSRELTISRTGRLAYATQRFDCELWESTPAPNETATTSRRLAGSGRQNWGVQVSPDGARLAFASLRLRVNQIWVCDRDGSNCRQVTFCTGHCTTPAWSPDGQDLVYIAHHDSMDVHRISVNGGPARRLTGHSAQDVMPSWSRDGRTVYFSSNRTGQFEIWKVAAEGGEEIPLTRHGAHFARESADGRSLFYLRLSQQTLVQAALDGSEERVVWRPINRSQHWAMRSGGIVWSERIADALTFRRLDVQTGTVTNLLRLARDTTLCTGFDVAPDGAVVYSIQRNEGDIIVVDGLDSWSGDSDRSTNATRAR